MAKLSAIFRTRKSRRIFGVSKRESVERMSSPRGSVREGTRIVLKEITATLHNSSPIYPSRRKVLLTRIIKYFIVSVSFPFAFLLCIYSLRANYFDNERNTVGMYALSRDDTILFSHPVCVELLIITRSGKRQRRTARSTSPHVFSLHPSSRFLLRLRG